jgi:hypothetical protein
VQDIVVGTLLVVVGALLAFRGYATLRVVIAVWGALAGFLIGVGLVAQVTDGSYLGSLLAWVVGLAVAVVFGSLAYLSYAVSVAIGMGAIGFAIGTTSMVVLGVTWSWVVVLAGLAAGIGLATLAIVGDLPLIILAVLGAFAGASAIVTGLLLLLGRLDGGDLAATSTSATLDLGGWWTAAYLALVLAGLSVQLAAHQVQRDSLRGAWRGHAPRPT